MQLFLVFKVLQMHSCVCNSLYNEERYIVNYFLNIIFLSVTTPTAGALPMKETYQSNFLSGKNNILKRNIEASTLALYYESEQKFKSTTQRETCGRNKVDASGDELTSENSAAETPYEDVTFSFKMMSRQYSTGPYACESCSQSTVQLKHSMVPNYVNASESKVVSKISHSNRYLHFGTEPYRLVTTNKRSTNPNVPEGENATSFNVRPTVISLVKREHLNDSALNKPFVKNMPCVQRDCNKNIFNDVTNLKYSPISKELYKKSGFRIIDKPKRLARETNTKRLTKYYSPSKIAAKMKVTTSSTLTNSNYPQIVKHVVAPAILDYVRHFEYTTMIAAHEPNVHTLSIDEESLRLKPFTKNYEPIAPIAPHEPNSREEEKKEIPPFLPSQNKATTRTTVDLNESSKCPCDFNDRFKPADNYPEPSSFSATVPNYPRTSEKRVSVQCYTDSTEMITCPAMAASCSVAAKQEANGYFNTWSTRIAVCPTCSSFSNQECGLDYKGYTEAAPNYPAISNPKIWSIPGPCQTQMATCQEEVQTCGLTTKFNDSQTCLVMTEFDDSQTCLVITEQDEEWHQLGSGLTEFATCPEEIDEDEWFHTSSSVTDRITNSEIQPFSEVSNDDERVDYKSSISKYYSETTTQYEWPNSVCPSSVDTSSDTPGNYLPEPSLTSLPIADATEETGSEEQPNSSINQNECVSPTTNLNDKKMISEKTPDYKWEPQPEGTPRIITTEHLGKDGVKSFSETNRPAATPSATTIKRTFKLFPHGPTRSSESWVDITRPPSYIDKKTSRVVPPKKKASTKMFFFFATDKLPLTSRGPVLESETPPSKILDCPYNVPLTTEESRNPGRGQVHDGIPLS